ncbi:MAG: photosystem II biosynthesis protein [Pseudanabaenaceae cyanobacterium]
MSKLPFEPSSRGKKKKPPKVAPTSPKVAQTKEPTPRMPEVVSRRMVRRVALFCGIPTLTGFAVLLVSYWIVSHHIFQLPNGAVVAVSMLFLGLGVAGLSYGALSASWDADRVGSWWGWSEFQKNLGYLTDAWKAMRNKGEVKQ